jgi:TldD protein
MIDRQILRDMVRTSEDDYVELRYHRRIANQLVAQRGRVDVAHHSMQSGVGVRVFSKGSWGFAATTDLSKKGVERALEDARKSAEILVKRHKATRKKPFNPTNIAKEHLARVDFIDPDYHASLAMPIADKLAHCIAMEAQLSRFSKNIVVSRVRYSEIFEDKIIVTSDGADAALSIVQPELSYSAIAERNGERQSAGTGAGVMGGWQRLNAHPTMNEGLEFVARTAVDLLSAGYAEGGIKTVILSPGVVGLLCHEAIGHTVEADFVRSGSVAAGKIGQRVGSDLVTMYDTGYEQRYAGAVGGIPFDDEGILARPVAIIEQGILKNYLHNRESAIEHGVAPTGSARAWLYDDEPLIRMRNTYFAPGKSSVEELISGVDDGYLIEGSGSGQADSNGEFMFGASHLFRIKNGKKRELLREASLSGIAFDVLQSVDGVSKDFLWDMGTGYCGKGQPAKVDAGGPHVRCQINLGGR